MTICDMILRKCKCVCGGGPIKSKLKNHKYRVRCKSCGRTTLYYRREFDAISAWRSEQIKRPEELANEVQAT